MGSFNEAFDTGFCFFIAKVKILLNKSRSIKIDVHLFMT